MGFVSMGFFKIKVLYCKYFLNGNLTTCCPPSTSGVKVLCEHPHSFFAILCLTKWSRRGCHHPHHHGSIRFVPFPPSVIVLSTDFILVLPPQVVLIVFRMEEPVVKGLDHEAKNVNCNHAARHDIGVRPRDHELRWVGVHPPEPQAAEHAGVQQDEAVV